ncbi:putative disease resistance protein RGA3 [Magnolia sinica]|uniref:putative disease resistance protein RGA3 n=1 Tax=Magnolia sinica TaxID=86752 RepID=UPI002659EF50|nr:putative disease resistance protein RGA3 [Magnolia sinica]
MADGLVPSVLIFLNSIIQSELRSVLCCRQELQDLSSAFTAIQSVLSDAEKRCRKEKAVNDWLVKLKDVAYDVEDVLDEWRAEALIYESQLSSRQSTLKRVCKSILRIITWEETADETEFHMKLGMDMRRRLKNVRERLDGICSEKSKFHLEESIDSRMETSERKTSSLIDESVIIGRTSGKERIIPWLVTDISRVSNDVPVISIIGLGGVGKTTLAQLIYNDERITRHFPKRMWVHVSDDFNETSISKAIIEAVEGRPAPSYSEWEMVQNHLLNVLKGERFLLVLDDIWNENQEKWDKLRLPLNGGVRGSRILITTRNETVLKTMRAVKMHQLEPLLESESWTLFSHIAFGEINTEEHVELEETGKKIARKCGGIPLIINRMANALRFKRTRWEWELVLDGETWDFSNVTRGIVLDLQLSYENMPPYLKRCFAFCSIFPKDHVIERETLIKLWMAQGFILPQESPVIERIGDGYFYDLLGRSLFDAPLTDFFGNIVHCKMIDIVHDFLKTVMRESYTMNVEFPDNIPLHVRHFSLKCSDDLSSIPGSLYKAKNLRTLLFIGWSRITVVADDFFENFKYLRALDLSGTKCSWLPTSLKNLKLLRYLNLSATGVVWLPEFICELYLLQTLKLNDCVELFELPKEMWKLARLRHLEINGTWELRALPHGIGRLTSLRTLSKFIVGDGMECGIGELKNLNLLQGELAVYHLERVSNEDDAKEAELMNKSHLRLLELYFDEDCWRLLEDEVDRTAGVLEGLRPHTSIEELKVIGYTGLKFPGWMEDSSFSNLVTVTLRDCHGCIKLPALGTLPSLRYLRIEGMNRVKFMGPEFYRNDNNGDLTGAAAAFPRLETLVLERMYILEEWVSKEDGGMPSLLELRIADCALLAKVPSFLHGKLWKVDLESPSMYWASCVSESVEFLVVKQIRDINMFIHLPFPRNIKYLVIENSEYQEFPVGIKNFCGLQILEIRDCKKLTSLPKELRDLPKLRQLKIKGCPSLEEWCEKYAEDDQQQAMSHIPNIWISNQEIKRDGREVAGQARAATKEL